MAKNYEVKKGEKGFIRRQKELSNNKVIFSLTDKELRELEETIKDIGCTKSSFIRRALKKAILSHKKKVWRQDKRKDETSDTD